MFSEQTHTHTEHGLNISQICQNPVTRKMSHQRLIIYAIAHQTMRSEFNIYNICNMLLSLSRYARGCWSAYECGSVGAHKIASNCCKRECETGIKNHWTNFDRNFVVCSKRLTANIHMRKHCSFNSIINCHGLASSHSIFYAVGIISDTTK